VNSAICRKMLGALFLLAMAGVARADTIQMEKLGYVPTEITAHVGDTIELVNSDFVAHTATARHGSWDVLIAVNAKKTVVLKTEGTVNYYCKFHLSSLAALHALNARVGERGERTHGAG
jgi:plastocyanin